MKDSFQTLKTLTTKSGTYGYYDLQELERKGVAEVSRLPFSIRVMLESLLRNEDGYQVTREDIEALARWRPDPGEINVPLKLARVILQDFTGVPAVVDLAAMRDAIKAKGGDPKRINPVVPADLVMVSAVDFSEMFAVPRGVATDLVVRVSNPKELATEVTEDTESDVTLLSVLGDLGG